MKTVEEIKDLGGESIIAPGDVTSISDIQKILESSISNYGSIEILINNAGVLKPTKVTDISEKENHHPSILLEWGKVTVRWWTHKIKGLHENDFIMSAKTDEIYNSNQ